VTEERALLRRTVATLIGRHAPPWAIRRVMASASGYDEQLWAVLCEQVGAAALLVPEEFGGAGGELADAAVVFEELGRALVPTPLLGTVLAELALLAGEPHDSVALEELLTGSAVGTLVFDPEHVIYGAVADVIVAARGGRIERWTQVVAEPLVSLDPTRPLARLRPGRTEVIGPDPGLADTAAILLAAEQIGAAARCLELTIDYTKQRVQFGRPIGSFQALKHRMADLYVALQSARAVVGEAVAAPGPTTAALARLAATEMFCAVAGEAIQLHGGIAITWEHDIQLYFKRAHTSAQLLDPPGTVLRSLEQQWQ